MNALVRLTAKPSISWAALFLFCALITLLPSLAGYPIVGHDNSQFLARLMDTRLFMQNEGLAVHWWTPSFASGMPVFASPISVQFSITQFLALFMNPFWAICGTTLFWALVGCWALYRLGRVVLQWSQWSAGFLALTVVTCGFFIVQSAAGHVVYQVYPLLAVYVLALMHPKSTLQFATLVGGFLFAQFFYSGGYFMAPMACLSAVMSVAIIGMLSPRHFPFADLFKRLLFSGIVAFFIALPKMIAAFSFVSQFPRPMGVEEMAGFFLPLRQFVMFPAWLFMRTFGGYTKGPTEFSHDFIFYPYGFWETDYSMFVGALVLALGAVMAVYYKIFRGTHRLRKIYAGITLALFFFVLVITTEKTVVYAWLRHLPFFKSMHVNCRFVGILILPIGLFAAWGFEALHQKINNRNLRVALVGLMFCGCLVQAFLYFPSFKIFPREFGLWYDVRESNTIYDVLINDPQRFSIIQKVVEPPNCNILEIESACQDVYDPIFGYNLEYFKPYIQVRGGPVDGEDPNYFNLNFAPAFVYPKFYGVPAFSRIPRTDATNFHLFITRRQTDWPLPWYQRLANMGAVTLLVVIGCFLATPALSWANKRRR